MINTVLFDLDGTLLPMDIDEFIKNYFHAMQVKFSTSGWDVEKLMSGVIQSTKAMIKNDGKETNEKVFWDTFTKVTGWDQTMVEEDFEAFYQNDFKLLEKLTGKNENMIEAVRLLKEKGYRLLLTTNPLFPQMAVNERLCWAGLDPNDFDIKTSYEDYHACKPNVRYFEEVISNCNLKIEQCMMVGNDSLEDGVVETLGISLYLVEDNLIHREETPLHSKWHGSSDEFLLFVKKMENIKK